MNGELGAEHQCPVGLPEQFAVDRVECANARGGEARSHNVLTETGRSRPLIACDAAYR